MQLHNGIHASITYFCFAFVKPETVNIGNVSWDFFIDQNIKTSSSNETFITDEKITSSTHIQNNNIGRVKYHSFKSQVQSQMGLVSKSLSHVSLYCKLLNFDFYVYELNKDMNKDSQKILKSFVIGLKFPFMA